VLGISGSLRAGSFNTALLRAAVELAPAGMRIDSFDRLRDLPHYDQDLDTAEPPAAVRALREEIRAADGLLIVTPEYNYGVPGVLKNAVDWASRPLATSPLAGKPIAMTSAAPGLFGGVRAQLALRQSFLWTGSVVVGKPEVMVGQARERFDAEGRLVDEISQRLVVSLLEALARTIHHTRLAG
jgi:chromate reductase